MRPAQWIVPVFAAVVACHASPPSAPAASDDALAYQQVKRIERDYPTWGALDTSLRVAPTDCRMPRVVGNGELTASVAETGAHAQKLYKLYARDPAAYRGVESGASQRGQVVVKEAFAAEPCAPAPAGEAAADSVTTAAGRFRAGKPAGLFMMLRGADDEVGEGAWQYATVDPAGVITALGRIDACIRCHRDAPHGGLFGLER